MQGQQIGPYKLMSLLGQGGQSVVWRSLDVRSNRSVALKVLRPGLAGPADVARLKREAALLASLSDPGLPRGHELYEDSHMTPALAMEFIQGTTLSSLLTSQHIGRVDMLIMGRELARIVSVLHGCGLAHRDIKPSNVMVRQGWQQGQRGGIVLVDLGIARGSRRHATSYTETGASLGTPAFMSPEAMLGSTRDEHAAAGDVFAIGVLIWSALTGQHPLGISMSASWAELTAAYTNRPNFTLDPGASAQFDAVVPGFSSVLARCVAPLTFRFTDAGQLHAALGNLTPVRTSMPGAAMSASDRPSASGHDTAALVRTPSALQLAGRDSAPTSAASTDTRMTEDRPAVLPPSSPRPAASVRPLKKALVPLALAGACSAMALVVLLPRVMPLVLHIGLEPRVHVAIPASNNYGVLREGPSTSTDNLEHLQPGSMVSVISPQITNGWYLVRTSSGKVGYMHRNIVSFY